MRHDAQRIAEGAMMTAYVGVALFLNRQVAGMLEYALYWVLSFPILIYTIRYGVKKALVPACSMFILSCILSFPTTIFYLACALVTGIVYGGGIRNKWSNRTLLCVVGILTLVSYFITMMVFASVFGYDPQQDIEFAIMIGQIFAIQGVNIAQLALVCSFLLVVLTAFLQTICIHLFAILIMKRLKIEGRKVKSLFDFHLPKAIGYISICIWVLFLLRNVIKLEGSSYMVLISAYITMNILMIAETLMSVMALGMLFKKRRYVLVGMFIVGLGLMWNITRDIILVYGMYSCVVNIRGKIKRGIIRWND